MPNNNKAKIKMPKTTMSKTTMCDTSKVETRRPKQQCLALTLPRQAKFLSNQSIRDKSYCTCEQIHGSPKQAWGFGMMTNFEELPNFFT